jgi:hypothetical protein
MKNCRKFYHNGGKNFNSALVPSSRDSLVKQEILAFAIAQNFLSACPPQAGNFSQAGFVLNSEIIIRFCFPISDYLNPKK